MKRNKWKKRSGLLAALLLAVSVITPVKADVPQVIFNGTTFEIQNAGSTYVPENLLPDLTNLIPGDSETQEIRVKNDATVFDSVKMYVRAVFLDGTKEVPSPEVAAALQADPRRGTTPENEYMAEFLSKVQMKVKVGDTLISDSTADKQEGLNEDVYLGTLRHGEEKTLTVQVTLPKELDNTYADRIGEMAWLFTAEGFYDGKLTVRKVWKDDGANRPAQITVRLMKDGKEDKTADLNAENMWTYTFDQLKQGHEWTVEEVNPPKGYHVEYRKEGDLMTITNIKANPEPVPQPGPKKTVQLTLLKKWEDDGGTHPDTATFTLYDGKRAVETVTIGEKDGWKHEWKALPGDGQWQIVEKQVPKEYTPSYQVKDGVVTVTNTRTLILTGQWNWPIPVLVAAGAFLLGVGVIRRRRSR